MSLPPIAHKTFFSTEGWVYEERSARVTRREFIGLLEDGWDAVDGELRGLYLDWRGSGVSERRRLGGGVWTWDWVDGVMEWLRGDLGIDSDSRWRYRIGTEEEENAWRDDGMVEVVGTSKHRSCRAPSSGENDTQDGEEDTEMDEPDEIVEDDPDEEEEDEDDWEDIDLMDEDEEERRIVYLERKLEEFDDPWADRCPRKTMKEREAFRSEQLERYERMVRADEGVEVEKAWYKKSVSWWDDYEEGDETEEDGGDEEDDESREKEEESEEEEGEEEDEEDGGEEREGENEGEECDGDEANEEDEEDTSMEMYLEM